MPRHNHSAPVRYMRVWLGLLSWLWGLAMKLAAVFSGLCRYSRASWIPLT